MLAGLIVQVYGVTTVEDAAGVNALRPDNVGVVLDEGVDTWDSVNEAMARAVVAQLTDVNVVALSLSVVLAGGLGPDNVRDAIRAVAPDGVDSETNTSRVDDRRRKDLEKVGRFIANARSTIGAHDG